MYSLLLVFSCNRLTIYCKCAIYTMYLLQSIQSNYLFKTLPQPFYIAQKLWRPALRPRRLIAPVAPRIRPLAGFTFPLRPRRFESP